MMIRSASALQNNYDGLVKLSKEKNEPIFITRDGEGEMVFTTIGAWDQIRRGVRCAQMLEAVLMSLCPGRSWICSAQKESSFAF